MSTMMEKLPQCQFYSGSSMCTIDSHWDMCPCPCHIMVHRGEWHQSEDGHIHIKGAIAQ